MSKICGHKCNENEHCGECAGDKLVNARKQNEIYRKALEEVKGHFSDDHMIDWIDGIFEDAQKLAGGK